MGGAEIWRDIGGEIRAGHCKGNYTVSLGGGYEAEDFTNGSIYKAEFKK